MLDQFGKERKTPDELKMIYALPPVFVLDPSFANLTQRSLKDMRIMQADAEKIWYIQLLRLASCKYICIYIYAYRAFK